MRFSKLKNSSRNIFYSLKKILGCTSIRQHTFLTNFSDEEPVVFDFGAHRGQFAEDFHQKFPRARIFCIEANPNLIQDIQQKAGNFAKITNSAVTSRSDVDCIQFSISSNPEASSTNLKIAEHFGNRATIEVPATTLANALSLAQASKISLIKMDIEGEEIQVLLSTAPETLQQIEQFTIEFHDSFTGDTAEVKRVFSYLKQIGFVSVVCSWPQNHDVFFVQYNSKPFLHRLKLLIQIYALTLVFTVRGIINPPPAINQRQ